MIVVLFVGKFLILAFPLNVQIPKCEGRPAPRNFTNAPRAITRPRRLSQGLGM